jgi:O-antigen/teichoic acid export membrane protein
LSTFKQLAGQTAIYGLSSILGRFLFFLLVPLYTRVYAQGEYGIVTQLYAWVVFLNVVFTYGLEIAYFRFLQSEKNHSKVYSTAMISIFASTFIFTAALFIFSSPAAAFVLKNVSKGPYYVRLFAVIIACDALTAIPFARLRQQNRAKRFAVIRLISIFANVGLNILFLVVFPALLKSNPDSVIGKLYDPSVGVGYVFIFNLISSALTLVLLLPEIKFTEGFDSQLWKHMIVYAFPLMIANFAGMINETFDRVLIPYLTPDKSSAMSQLGVYGACYKLSMIMTLFVQTFRYAAEPFFFNHSTKENPQATYARVMKMFVIVCSLIFLGVMLYIDIVKHFIGPDFRSGLGIVPILLMANLCLGVYYNLSIWYKLTSKTRWGAWLSVFGAVITLVCNFLLIPVMGYMGAAWTTLICYALMMIASYIIGQKYYPVPYNLRSFFFYLVMAIIFWLTSVFIKKEFELSDKVMLGINTVLILVFAAVAWKSERNKNSYLRAG